MAAFTASTSGTTALNLLADVNGVPFSVVTLAGTGASSMTTSIVDTNLNQFKISGTVGSLVSPAAFGYTLTTDWGSACSVHASSATATITVLSASTVSLTSAAPTESQSVCVGSAITSNYLFYWWRSKWSNLFSYMELQLTGLTSGTYCV